MEWDVPLRRVTRMNWLGLIPLLLGLFMLYMAVRGKPRHPLGSGVGVTEMLVQRLPGGLWRLVTVVAGVLLIAFGVGATWFGIG
jgi:hypothetical protein